MDRDKIFLFLPGSSMDNTSSSSLDIGVKEPCEGRPPSSSSGPPPAANSDVMLPQLADLKPSIEDGDNMDVGSDPSKTHAGRVCQKKRTLEESDSDGYDSQTMRSELLKGKCKRRKYLQVDNPMLPEEAPATAETSGNESDPFGVLKEASAPLREEEPDTSMIPQSLYSLLGPIWDRHVDLH